MPTATPLGPEVDRGDLRDLFELAESETGCRDGSLTYAYRSGGLHEMEGCGTTSRYTFACHGLCGWLSVQELEKHAGFVMKCEDVTAAELTRGEWGVRGCGKQLTYGYGMRGFGEFKWLLDEPDEDEDEDD